MSWSGDVPISLPSDPASARPPTPAKGRFSQDELRPFPLVAIAFTAVVVVGSQLWPDTIPLGVTLRGALLGAGTGLMAVGLVLIYRTTRVINFSYAAMGTFGSAIAAALKIGKDVPWSIAAPVGVAAGVLAGALVEVLIIRRFRRAPRLTLTVATIGLAQLFGGLTYYVPGWFDAPAVQGSFETRLSGYSVRWFDESFNGNDLVLLAVVPVVLVGLTWFLLRTEAGMAVRGMAENMDRARLLGIPVNRLSLLLWSLAGGLAALTVVVQAPNSGNPFDIAAGPTILLPALAAAVVSGMSSLSRAFTVGVFLGAIDQIVQANVEKRALTSVVFLGVIVVALLVQRRHGASRALAADETSWSLLRTGRRLPAALARLPEVRMLKLGAWLVVAAAVVALPLLGSDSQIFDGTVTVIFAIAALSLVVLMGWGGVVSLGQFAIVGVGGVVAATLLHDRNTDLFVTLGAAAVAGGVVALVVGLPALRISGQLLAVTTLAFAVAADTYFFEPANYEGWPPDSYVRPHLWGEVDLADERWLYGLALAVLGVVALVTHNLRRARAGRAVTATRDNIRAAASVGVNTVETRLAGFVFAGMFAGVAGGLHAVALEGIPEGTYPVQYSMLLMSMAVIGGASSIAGVVAGVALVQWAGYLFPAEVQLLMTGVGLLVILWLLPAGLGGVFEGIRDRVAYAAARRRGISLVDDLATIDQPVETVTVGSGETPAVGGTAPLLVCDGVESSYGTLQVLFGIDTVVGRGELLALLGTNGAGKSTLLRSISGLLPPHDGRVVFDGRDITKLSAEQIARQGLSLMPGGRGVFPTLTVAENLRLASWMLRRRRGEASGARKQAVALFPILRERFDQLAGDLSGGEQQQLSLAMAFVTRPKLLCIDELSLGLAPTVVGQLVDKVREIHASGTSVVVVEQSVNVALLLAERAVFLEKGQVRFRGPTAGLLERPDVLRAVFLGGADDGQHPHPPTPPGQRRSRAVTLECRGLTKRFGGITAVNRVDLTIPPATIVGLIGHNGAGKTTLFDVLTGYLPSDGGRVVLDGRDITRQTPHRRAVRALGRSFQEARLYPSLTVADTLAVALERHLLNRDPLAAALRLPVSTWSERHARRRVDELIELLGLDRYRDHPTGELSTGTRRIVELGCMLAHDPAVLLLDEPSAGVAQRETEALVPLLRRVQAEAGCSLVVVEHDMALLGSLCDALVCLEEGTVIAWGAPDDVLQDHRVVASYLGTDHEVVQRSGPGRQPGPSPWGLPRRSPAPR
jgi:ABC-type branched-subunit amino acid transport system ATPase component/ABC-type branched-subunit amino acid transport system permease subunit